MSSLCIQIILNLSSTSVTEVEFSPSNFDFRITNLQNTLQQISSDIDLQVSGKTLPRRNFVLLH